MSKTIQVKKEPTVRVTIDIPESLYLKMKHTTVSKRQTVRTYFLNLLKQELNR